MSERGVLVVLDYVPCHDREGSRLPNVHIVFPHMPSLHVFSVPVEREYKTVKDVAAWAESKGFSCTVWTRACTYHDGGMTPKVDDDPGWLAFYRSMR